MALVVPTSYSTFADATNLPGGVLSPYILAQLPADADLGWVSDIRGVAAVEELKWKPFHQHRERLQAKADLWRRIERSMATATIVIVKPSEVERKLRSDLAARGAEMGVDVSADRLRQACAVALIAETPVAFLPNRISESLGLYPFELFVSFDKFTPASILQQVGGKLKDAKVFAARAHAMFDSQHLSSGAMRTSDAFLPSSPRNVVLRELMSIGRNFDEEHPHSVAVLNDAAATIAESLAGVLPMIGKLADRPLVREYSSRDIDQLQAADIAAGWAHELVALGNEQALLARFGRVLVNGTLLK